MFNYEKTTKKIPRRLVFISLFLSIFVLTIGIFYLTTYLNNKVTPFKEKLVELEQKANEDTKIDDFIINHYDYDDYNNFKIKFYADDFDINAYKVTYKLAVLKKNIQGNLVKNSMNYTTTMTANWVGLNEISSKSSNLTVLNKDNIEYDDYDFKSTTVSKIEKVCKRTNPLIPFPKPTTYVLLEYNLTFEGKTTKYADIIKYPYGSYHIDKGGFPA